MNREHNPRTHQVFWCNSCDNKQVDSEKPETGKFFVQFGHSWNPNTREYDGDYRSVMFAMCPACLRWQKGE